MSEDPNQRTGRGRPPGAHEDRVPVATPDTGSEACRPGGDPSGFAVAE